MSRRPLQNPVERLAKAQDRMAPGGLLWSESPIPRRYSPRVREAGGPPPVEYWMTLVETTEFYQVWNFVPEPTLPSTAGHFRVTYTSAVGTALQVDYSVPPLDTYAVMLLNPGPYTAGVAYDTEPIAQPADGGLVALIALPSLAATIQWIPE